MEFKPKDPKRVEQGKRLAEYNRERREELLRIEAEKHQKENEKFEAELVEFEKWRNGKDNTQAYQDDALTINENTQEENTKKPVTQSEASKSNTLISLTALTVIGIGTGLPVYKFDLLPQKRTKRKPNDDGDKQRPQHTNPQKPKIISRLERLE